MNDDSQREASAWLAVAREDLRVVEACLALEDPAFSGAAYHCQQAAEKLLKGLLVSQHLAFRKTHDLDELADKAAEALPALAALFDAVRGLTVWSIAYRYPSLEDTPEPLPTRDEIDTSVLAIQAIATELQRFCS